MARGKRVRSLPGLINLARQKKCVIAQNGTMLGAKHCAASFVISMQAVIVQRIIDRGLWEYIPQGRNPKYRKAPWEKRHATS